MIDPGDFEDIKEVRHISGREDASERVVNDLLDQGWVIVECAIISRDKWDKHKDNQEVIMADYSIVYIMGRIR